MNKTDVLIIGAGIAGSTLALKLAEKGRHVTLISSGKHFLETNSSLAQGGICYQVDDFLMEDILLAGNGLCDPKAAQQLVTLGPHCVEELLLSPEDIPFNRKEDHKLALTKEAAHRLSRILYCRDQTGKAMMTAMHKRIENHPNITMLWSRDAVDLITLSHHSKKKTDIYRPLTCVGAYVYDRASMRVEGFLAGETILATGGAGELFLHSTNQPGARGDGLAMAFRAGVRIMNTEYVQFHPTSLYVAGEKRFLLSETLRGEGGKLLSYDFKPFMQKYHSDGDLAPRDVISRAIYDQMDRFEVPHVWLDVSFLDTEYLKKRFPYIYATCLEKGFDLTQQPVPIVPAAHYSCGGISVDLEGRTTMQRLWAIGEVACSGLHGANRLASTSLLEGIVWASTCSDAIMKEIQKKYFPEVEEWVMGNETVDLALVHQDFMTIKQTMWNYVGIVRSPQRLRRGLKMLGQLKWEIEAFYEKAELCPELIGLRHAIEAALLITQGATRNRNSRGCHFLANKENLQYTNTQFLWGISSVG